MLLREPEVATSVVGPPGQLEGMSPLHILAMRDEQMVVGHGATTSVSYQCFCSGLSASSGMWIGKIDCLVLSGKWIGTIDCLVLSGRLIGMIDCSSCKVD